MWKPEARSRKMGQKGKLKDNLPHTCLCQAWEVGKYCVSPGTFLLTSFRVSSKSFLWHNRQWAHVIPGNPWLFLHQDFAVFLDNYFPPLCTREKGSIPCSDAIQMPIAWSPLITTWSFQVRRLPSLGLSWDCLRVMGWPCQWSKMQPAEHEGPQADGELS